MGVTEPGIHTVSRDDYHADNDGPTLSASIARILCTASPLHAWTAHPRLNPDYQPVEASHFDVGIVAHAVLLEGKSAVELVDAPDWRTAAAREARDDARARGLVPLLAHAYEGVFDMVEVARVQLAQHNADPPLFQDGKPEQTLIWHEPNGVMCRARPDWLRDDLRAVDDLKTTSRTANPEFWSRNLFTTGYDVQAAFYLRGLFRLTGKDAQFRFCVIETSPPYAMSVLTLGPDALLLANRKVDHAITLWADCLANDSWPGYTREVCWAKLPPYLEAQWLEQETRQEAA